MNELDSPYFSVFVHFERWRPKSHLPVKKIKREVETWLRTLDYETERRLLENERFYSSTVFPVENEGEVIYLHAYPNQHPGTGSFSGNQGSSLDNRGLENRGLALRGAVEEKRNRYGDLGQPYIIAVSDYTYFLEPKYIHYGLLGGSRPTMPPHGERCTSARKPTGTYLDV